MASERCFDVMFSPLVESHSPNFKRHFPNYKEGLVYSTPGNYVTLSEYPNNAAEVYNMKVRPDDIFVMTFPKSGIEIFSCKTEFASRRSIAGTTWMQELVWLLTNDCDFEKAKQPLNIRSPFLE